MPTTETSVNKVYGPIVLVSLALSAPLFASGENPDASFYKSAAEGGLAEVQLGQLAQDKSITLSVQEFGLMMLTDHSVANEKLRMLAERKNIELPDSPSVGQMAAKTKLEVLSGATFDKSFIKGMLTDHQETIKTFEKEARSGQDPDAKSFAQATLPTLKIHLKKIQAIAAAQGIEAG
jgi:putative membrane protein